jgi:rhamnose utilization protein RhaD (predicted bifunctional aldolase and dehydrogenase)
MIQNIDWDSCEGIILHNHGIFTFDDDPKISYSKMIDAVTQAEEFLDKNASIVVEKHMPKANLDIELLQKIINTEKGYNAILKIDQSPLALHYASLRDIKNIATRGVLTPEHIIRTKRIPMILEDNNIQKAIDDYKVAYKGYFETYKNNEICLNSSPNYIIVKNYGIVYIGKNEKEANIISDIISHTIKAVLKADMLGGYKSISLKDSFEMEYWELEQNKLKK